MKCVELFVLLLINWPNQLPVSGECQITTKNVTIENTHNKDKTMKIQKILPGFSNPPLELVAESLNLEIEPLQLEMANWIEYPYKPDVSVRIAYNENELFLRYQVKEQSVKADVAKNNGRVWTDSCVEFFVSPEGNDEYYNLEMNCIGTILLAYRGEGKEAVYGTEEQIATIRRISTLGTTPFAERKEPTEWEITVAIPWELFFGHKLKPERGTKMRCNFYKCGDELSVPHFVSWTKISTEKPSFHQPKFFGGIEFE